MRIISGLFRSKKILEPKDTHTRPLKDLTKESIFNIINHSNKFSININKANVLDLFSGVGSFGIECLSRNVKKVIFVENYNGVLPILKRNLENLNLNIWKKDLDVGLNGSFICTKIFGTLMSSKKKGVILNISSDLSIILLYHEIIKF